MSHKPQNAIEVCLYFSQAFWRKVSETGLWQIFETITGIKYFYGFEFVWEIDGSNKSDTF